MANNRTRLIYQSEALYVSEGDSTGVMFNLNGITGSNSNSWAEFTGYAQTTGVTPAQFSAALRTGINQLYRIQSANYAFNITRTDVNQYGQLSQLDRIITQPPVVALDFSYLLANFENEQSLGFVVDGSSSAISGILNGTTNDKNYFIKITPEGVDAIGDYTTPSPQNNTIGIGNAFLTSYNFTASVGNLPQVSISAEGANLEFYQSTLWSGLTPALNVSNGRRWNVTNNNGTQNFRFALPPTVSSAGTGIAGISVLRPGDISLSLTKRDSEGIDDSSLIATGVYDLPGADLSVIENANIQSASISFDLSREAIERLGSRFPRTRAITFPVTVSVSIDALIGNLTTGSLADLINCDESYDLQIQLSKPASCTDFSVVPVCRYTVKDMKLDSESFSTAIGSNGTATLSFSTQIGSAQQLDVGLFMSGVAV